MANDFAGVESADLQAGYQLLSQETIDEWLNKRGMVKGVCVLDFGQGDCNAIVGQDGKPILFFDMGGGKHVGSSTHPWHVAWQGHQCHDKVLDLSRVPSVILSHWDGDHYSTAWYMSHPGAKEVPGTAGTATALRWLAPRQCSHPSKLDYVRDLDDNLRCWPKNVTSHTFVLDPATTLKVTKCTDTSGGAYDPNLDGLAVVLERKVKGGLERMVLPGDAPFQFIPACDPPLDDVVLLLAFHHGSERHFEGKTIERLPLPKTDPGKIAYTFGLKRDGRRCHGHPRPKAIAEYVNKGWTERLMPAGSFNPWPPEDEKPGVSDGRQDVSQDFSPAAPRRIALRRKKKSAGS